MIMVPTWLHLLSFFAFLLSLVASEAILVGEASSRTFSRGSTAEGNPLVMNCPTGPDSTLKTPSVLSDDVAGDADVVPAPAAAYQWFVRLLAVWGILLVYLGKA